MTAEKKSLDFCAVPTCFNYRNDDISLHRFPNDAQLKKLWLQAVKLKNCSNASRICSDHFLPDDFHLPGVTTMRRRLRLNIIPSVKLPSTYEYQKTVCKPLILRRKSCKLKEDFQNTVNRSHVFDMTQSHLKISNQLEDSSSQLCYESQQSEDFIKLKTIADEINNDCYN